MTGTLWVLATCLLVPGQTHLDEGKITGIVVNGSQGGAPSGGTEVVLRVRVNGQFVPTAVTDTDAEGSFLFDGLPVGEEHRYLPGANRDGIHYSGPEIRLTAEHPHAVANLTVHDSCRQPSPLVIRRFDIQIQTEPYALRVTESLVIDNPTQTTYVGLRGSTGVEPVTLQLGIPTGVVPTSLRTELDGGRVSYKDGTLVTGAPWPPGPRDLKLTYTLPREEAHRVWQRRLDLPCDFVRVQVDNATPEEVSCSLPPSPRTSLSHLGFDSGGDLLPAGHLIQVQLGPSGPSWVAYAQWGALGVLWFMIAVVCMAFLRRPGRVILQPHVDGTAARKSRRPAMSRDGGSRPHGRRTSV